MPSRIAANIERLAPYSSLGTADWYWEQSRWPGYAFGKSGGDLEACYVVLASPESMKAGQRRSFILAFEESPAFHVDRVCRSRLPISPLLLAGGWHFGEA
jgi:hypothetical protein